MTRDAEPPSAARQRLRALLGNLTPPSAPRGTLLHRASTDAFDVERWRLDLAADEAAPALLVRPRGRAPRGAVLYHHAHGHRPEIGKEELLAGRPMLCDPPYAVALARLGFAALAIDHRGFSERSAVPERMLVKRGLWEGVPLWGRRIADAIAASAWLDTQAALAALPRIAMGFSMGGSLAWWSAALDPRVTAVVDACCLAEFDALLATGAYDLHAEYYFVPGLLRAFTAAQINAMILPRPHLSLVGREDPLTPADGVAAIDASMRAAAHRAGAPGAWQQSVHPTGHEETPAMREEILAFVEAQAT
jgi:dienelactone hydrolase